MSAFLSALGSFLASTLAKLLNLILSTPGETTTVDDGKGTQDVKPSAKDDTLDRYSHIDE